MPGERRVQLDREIGPRDHGVHAEHVRARPPCGWVGLRPAVRAKGDSTRPVDMPGAQSNHVSADVQRRVWAAAVGADMAGAPPRDQDVCGAGLASSEDRRWIESFHGEPDAKRQLREELWDCF